MSSSIIDIEFIADSKLFDRYVSDRPLHKIAGVKEIFSSIGESIKSWVSELADEFREDPLKTILSVTATGLFTIFTPWWAGLIAMLAREFYQKEFDEIWNKAKHLLYSFMSKNDKLTNSDIKNIVSQATGGAANADDGALNGEAVFRRIAIAEKWYRKGMIPRMPLAREAGVIDFAAKPVIWTIKKVVSPSTAKSFIGKVVSYALKCIIIALAGKGIGKAVKSVAPNATETAKSFFGGVAGGISNLLGGGLGKSHNLKPSGFGEEREPENWEEPFPKSRAAEMLANWAVRRYPQLSSVRNDMMQTESFKKVLRAIQNNNLNNHYENKTYIPHAIEGHRVNDKAELVELFVGEIAPKVQQAQQANK